MFYRTTLRRQLMLFIVALLALGLLTGCGRGRNNDADGPGEAPAVAEETVVEEAAAEETAEEPPTADEPVQEESAQEDSADEQPAAEEPVEEPVAEESAAEEPAAEQATVGGDIVQGVCNHPYYPIRDGAVYRYLITTEGEEPTEMTSQYNVTGPDTFTTVQSYSGITTEMSWRCTEEGLLSTDFGMNALEMAEMPDAPDVEFTMDSVSGVTVPLPDELQVGNQWQSIITMSSSVTMEGMDIRMNMEAVTDNTLTSFEQVTTPAGAYDAARIDTTTTVNMEMDMGDLGAMAAPGMEGLSMDSTMWLAEGVGMVKSVSGAPGGWTSTTELVAIE